MNLPGLLTLCAIVLFPYPAFSQVDSFEHDGYMRYWLQELPPGYDPGNEYALVLAFHGGGGNVIQFREQSQLSVKAEEAGFILVYPQGVRHPNASLFTWNGGACCGYAMEQNIDDVGFVDRLIDTLLQQFSIDKDRIYATGLSNGGYMTYRLACELPDRIAAIAPVACSMNTACTPDHAVSIIHFHSYLDSNIPYDGGVGDGISDHYNPPLDSVLNEWASFNQCEVSNDTLRDGNDYDHIAWSDCYCDSRVELYITHDGGHSWPGGMATALGDPPSEVIDANDRMWDFFQGQENCNIPVAGEHPSLQMETLSIRPNPFTNRLFIHWPDDVREGEWTVFNAFGQVVDRGVWRQAESQLLDLAALTPGLYLISLDSGKHQFVQRIIKTAP